MAERWRHRAATLYRQAGCNIDDTFYYKPKRMRWRTFNRLIDQAEEYDGAWIGFGLRHFVGG